MTDWFCVWTTPAGERLAKSDLEEAGFEVFLPIEVVTLRPARHRRDQRKKTISRPLFPRYLFVGLPCGWHDFAGVRRSKRVLDLLRDAYGCPMRIDEGVVKAIMADMSLGKYDEASTRAAKEAERLKSMTERAAEVRPGHMFTMQNGLWRGFMATVTAVRKREIRIEIKGVDGATLSVDVPATFYDEVGLLSGTSRATA